MSKQSPNGITASTPSFIPLIENGSNLRTRVLELDDRIQTVDLCGETQWMTLRTFLAAATKPPQGLISPLERFKQISADLSHRKDDKDQIQSYLKVRVQKIVDGTETVIDGELRISSDLLKYLKEAEAKFSAPLNAEMHAFVKDAYTSDPLFTYTIMCSSRFNGLRRNALGSLRNFSR